MTVKTIGKQFKDIAKNLNWNILFKTITVDGLLKFAKDKSNFVNEKWEIPSKLTKDNCLIYDALKDCYLLPVRKEAGSPVNLQALVDAATALANVDNDEIRTVSLNARVDGQARLKSLFLELFMKPQEDEFLF